MTDSERQYKRCTRCRVDKPLNTSHFRHRADPGKQHIWRSTCNRCEATRRTEQNRLKKEAQKHCSQCKQTKPSTEFHAREKSLDGRQASCKACDAARSAPPVRTIADTAKICGMCCNLPHRRPRIGKCKCGLRWGAEARPELETRRYYEHAQG